MEKRDKIIDRIRNQVNNQEYNLIIDEAWNNYLQKTMFTSNPKWLEPVPVIDMKTGEIHTGARQYHKMGFFEKCKTDTEFSDRWGLKIEESELSLERRYNIWFNNNYETGMERFFDPNELPDFDNSYYVPTPTKLVTVIYHEVKGELYE